MVFTNSLSSYYEKFLATGEVKCIDEEIPFEIPKGWEWSRMGSIGDWGAGATPAKGNTSYYGGNILWLRTGELNNSIVNDTEIKITDKALKECSLRMNKAGDVLIAMYGATIGKVAIAGCELTTNQACCACTPIGIFNYYLFYFLMESQVDFIKKGEGGAQPNISREKLVAHLMPIPPIQEQHRIVERIKDVLPLIDKYALSQIALDELNRSINDKLKKSILQEAIQGKLVPQIVDEGTAQELLEQIKLEKQKLVKDGKLKKSALTDSIIFKGDDNKYYEQVGKKCLDITEQIPFETPKNWVWTRLSHIANIYTGNSISETEKKSKFTDVIGRYYIGTKDVDFNNRIIYDNGIAIPKQYEPDFRLAPNNSILMCIEGGSAGRKIAILNQDVCFGNKLCCFSPFVGIGKYMYYYLQSPSFFELFNLNKTGIIGGVSIAKVKEILIPLPPIKEQQRIVAQIEKLFEQLR
ncbi:restriction endonuclease subunit S [Bacteroides fragilis]|uniref:restriction endonuclease subunit S n=1 Tax=Bacteroides fragilis TaxID=817 RepID=UPI0022AAC44F|nr:restriction endonuclease subunit S [Bacteroides fragilis]MCE8583636.1 restriction endonuclease subunit S [Bacteroides fragilis]MCE8665235.1 restriction endonuclease subunit S [Bacteroides fragilis]MCZ2696083.1 restriction endonuclease subunit S [Bacteroides fragilis]